MKVVKIHFDDCIYLHNIYVCIPIIYIETYVYIYIYTYSQMFPLNIATGWTFRPGH